MYCQMLEGDAWKEAKMDKTKIDKMSGRLVAVLHNFQNTNCATDQQLGQLYELMQQIKNQAQEDADAEDARIIGTLDKKSKPDQ